MPAADPSAALLRLTSFARSLLHQQGLDDLLWHITRQVGELFAFEDCVLYLLRNGELVQCAAYGVKSPGLREIRNRIVVPMGQGIVGAVAASGVAERIDDVRSDPRYIPDAFEGRSELAVPIAYGGRVIGVLDGESSQLAGFSAEDQATFELVATLAAPRIASAMAEQSMLKAQAELQRMEAQRDERERQHNTERLESLGQLAGGIAHDFNNLLTAILGNVALARDRVDESDVAEMLDDAAAACDRARGLTKQLLTFASGGAPVRAVGDLGPLVREEATATAAGTSLQLSVELPDEPLQVSFDREQVRHLVRHLTINAIEAQPNGGSLRITGRLQRIGEKAHVEVRWQDAGPGVPATVRSRIFDPYFTTKLEGTGLGLSSAFWIARRHGGSLELDGGTGRGACFVLRLPAVAEVPRPSPTRPLGAPAERLRTLLLDDDVAVRQVIMRMLKGLGHEVTAVADGPSCVREFTLAHVSGRTYDVALLDLTLPGGMGGLETLAALRRIAPGLPAIVVSGYHDTDALANPAQHGFFARLEKPFTSSGLQAAITEALVNARS